MPSFLFWNLKGKESIGPIIANLAWQYDVDVLMLAECKIEPGPFLTTLNRPNDSKYHYVPRNTCKKIEIFTRFASNFIESIHEENRLTIRRLRLHGQTDILLAVGHLPSKMHRRNTSQSGPCIRLAKSIERAEEEVGHRRTVLVGDLNVNPFEDGMVMAEGLHAVMTRGIARKETRKVDGVTYPFFYNPMWSLFGDGSPGPPGTYYNWRTEDNVYFWNMFDQVLLRPDLLDMFNNESLQILDSVGKISLVDDNGLPRKEISDHLPILFELNL
jgi:hypothetical protein